MFHKFVIVLWPVVYQLNSNKSYGAITLLIFILSAVSFAAVDWKSQYLNVSYFLNENYSAFRSLQGVCFSIFIIIAGSLLPHRMRIPEINVLMTINIMSLAFFWIAIVSGRLSDAAVVLEPFLAGKLLQNKTYASFLFFLILILSWIVGFNSHGKNSTCLLEA